MAIRSLLYTEYLVLNDTEKHNPWAVLLMSFRVEPRQNGRIRKQTRNENPIVASSQPSAQHCKRQANSVGGALGSGHHIVSVVRLGIVRETLSLFALEQCWHGPGTPRPD